MAVGSREHMMRRVESVLLERLGHHCSAPGWQRPNRDRAANTDETVFHAHGSHRCLVKAATDGSDRSTLLRVGVPCCGAAQPSGGDGHGVGPVLVFELHDTFGIATHGLGGAFQHFADDAHCGR